MRQSIAVLGTGNFGLKHAAVLRAMGAEPVLVPARSSRVDEFRAEGWPAGRTLAEAYDAGARHCIVATDTGRHARDAVAALRLGFDVLVEKPLARDAKEARAVLTEARRGKRRAFVGCVLRFSKSLAVFRRLLGRIGTLHAVSVECRSHLPDWRPSRDYRRSYSARRGEGGVLRELVHEIDYTGWILGWPTAVCGFVGNTGRLRIAAEETADLYWRAPGGARVSVCLDYLSVPPRRRMVAYGGLGTLEWDGIAHTVRLWGRARTARTFRAEETPLGRLAAQDRAFLRGGKGMASLRDGLRALAVCDAARRSSRMHKTEKVKPS